MLNQRPNTTPAFRFSPVRRCPRCKLRAPCRLLSLHRTPEGTAKSLRPLRRTRADVKMAGFQGRFHRVGHCDCVGVLPRAAGVVRVGSPSEAANKNDDDEERSRKMARPLAASWGRGGPAPTNRRPRVCAWAAPGDDYDTCFRVGPGRLRMFN